MPALSINNFGKRPPRWFRRLKKAILILTLAANGMIASYGFEDQLLTARLQLWCTMGVAAILEAFEALLKDDGEDLSPITG
jgi:hypothetical protein